MTAVLDIHVAEEDHVGLGDPVPFQPLFANSLQVIMDFKKKPLIPKNQSLRSSIIYMAVADIIEHEIIALQTFLNILIIEQPQSFSKPLSGQVFVMT